MNTIKSGQKAPLPLRPCVGIALFNRQGRVWVGRRRHAGSLLPNAAKGLWQLPQGGIEAGEVPLAAAKRELWEETGVKSAEFLAEAKNWLSYELPAELLAGKRGKKPLGGRYRGQTQKWFAFLFTGETSEIAVNPPPAGNETEFDIWEWRDLAAIIEDIVAFKHDIYRQVAAEFAPIAAELHRSAGGQ
ncbi:MAG: RNA pyrophosphohydrolase [Candidatus Tokpelaia sp.]|nr:MAG: RNA pyrophosphohydrolase [Candidatus Tokpelaia sp.]KAA6207486.1 MAG: RNA pyrophosphohydrolase [Candidatus Tokpelaia sp.]KAA6405239.1 RNA pyrophosphohydrolase [Candidatus Tokpelaia sp.]